jgi:hypothetical protein
MAVLCASLQAQTQLDNVLIWNTGHYIAAGGDILRVIENKKANEYFIVFL